MTAVNVANDAGVKVMSYNTEGKNGGRAVSGVFLTTQKSQD